MYIPNPEQSSKNPTITNTPHFLHFLVCSVICLASQIISVGSEAAWISIYYPRIGHCCVSLNSKALLTASSESQVTKAETGV